MSRVTCHVSRVTCHMSRVTCHVSHVILFFFFFFRQSGEAYRWRVCYQRGLPRLVFKLLKFFCGFTWERKQLQWWGQEQRRPVLESEINSLCEIDCTITITRRTFLKQPFQVTGWHEDVFFSIGPPPLSLVIKLLHFFLLFWSAMRAARLLRKDSVQTASLHWLVSLI